MASVWEPVRRRRRLRLSAAAFAFVRRRSFTSVFICAVLRRCCSVAASFSPRLATPHSPRARSDIPERRGEKNQGCRSLHAYLSANFP